MSETTYAELKDPTGQDFTYCIMSERQCQLHDAEQTAMSTKYDRSKQLLTRTNVRNSNLHQNEASFTAEAEQVYEDAFYRCARMLNLPNTLFAYYFLHLDLSSEGSP